jgi:hypothetical protein
VVAEEVRRMNHAGHYDTDWRDPRLLMAGLRT